MAAKGRITIFPDLCKGCGYCMTFCPKDCIAMGHEANTNGYFYAVFNDPEACNGCTICAVMCPDFAIEVFKG